MSPAKRAATLTRDVVAHAALSQIDARGVGDFSLREVARSLNVFPTALYWHVPNRAALLSDAVALVLVGVVPDALQGAAAHDDWPQWVERFCVAYRRAVAQRPRVAPLLNGQLSSNGDANFAIAEAVLTTLEEAGFSGAGLRTAYNCILGGLVGWVGLEFAPGPGSDAATADLEARLSSIDAQRHPTLSRNLGRLRDRSFALRVVSGDVSPLESSFRAFVQALVAGLKLQLIRE